MKELKHGNFYAAYFREVEVNDLERCRVDLWDEICLLRTHVRRLVSYLDEADSYGEDPVKMFTMLEAAMRALGTLVHYQADLEEGGKKDERSLEEALRSKNKDWLLA